MAVSRETVAVAEQVDARVDDDDARTGGRECVAQHPAEGPGAAGDDGGASSEVGQVGGRPVVIARPPGKWGRSRATAG